LCETGGTGTLNGATARIAHVAEQRSFHDVPGQRRAHRAMVGGSHAVFIQAKTD
jgi:hypothetical protein